VEFGRELNTYGLLMPVLPDQLSGLPHIGVVVGRRLSYNKKLIKGGTRSRAIIAMAEEKIRRNRRTKQGRSVFRNGRGRLNTENPIYIEE